MTINFANLSNEGINIPSSQKVNSPAGKKKEILGAGDLAQALVDAPAKAQRFISDEEIRYYAEIFVNDENVLVVAEAEIFEVIQQNYPYEKAENTEVFIFGERLKRLVQETIEVSMGYLSVINFDEKSQEFYILETHYITILKEIETGEIECIIDQILQ